MTNIILYYANCNSVYPEDEGSRLLRKVNNLISDYMALHPRGEQFLHSLPWPHVLKQILHSPKESVYWILAPSHIFVTPARRKGNNESVSDTLQDRVSGVSIRQHHCHPLQVQRSRWKVGWLLKAPVLPRLRICCWQVCSPQCTFQE
jgi:hypothetical protein